MTTVQEASQRSAAQVPERVVSNRTRRPLIVGILAVLAGVGLICIGTIVLDTVTAWPRWISVLVGIGMVYRGLEVCLRALFRRKVPLGAWLSAIWLIGLLVLAVFAPILGFEKPNYLPLTVHIYQRADLFSSHPLGTDGFGRGDLSRAIYGARVSLLLGFGCTAVGLIVGSTLGIVAGYYRGRIGRLISIANDTLLAFPPLVFLLALVAALRPSVGTLFVALSLLTIPTIVRLARSSTMNLAGRDFVLAAKVSGAGDARIMAREILPNILWSLLSYGMVLVAIIIIAEASLSFLGLGIKVPYPTWGNMIAANQTVFQTEPTTVVVPAVFLFLTVFACNRLGEEGRKRSEVREVVM